MVKELREAKKSLRKDNSVQKQHLKKAEKERLNLQKQLDRLREKPPSSSSNDAVSFRAGARLKGEDLDEAVCDYQKSHGDAELHKTVETAEGTKKNQTVYVCAVRWGHMLFFFVLSFPQNILK